MKPKKVYLFVFDTLADWEYGYAVAGINNPQFQKNADRYKRAALGLFAQSAGRFTHNMNLPSFGLRRQTPTEQTIAGTQSWLRTISVQTAAAGHSATVRLLSQMEAGTARHGALASTRCHSTTSMQPKLRRRSSMANIFGRSSNLCC